MSRSPFDHSAWCGGFRNRQNAIEENIKVKNR